MTDLEEFVVKGDEINVFCATGGISWGYICDDKACDGRRYIGWDSATDVAAGAVAHLIWHADGMPECKHCGSTLSGDAVKAGECRTGECPERDGGWR